MGRDHVSARGAGFPGDFRGIAVAIAISMVVTFLPPAYAIEPPPELRYTCVDAQDVVYQAVSPTECESKERVVTVPDDRPVHWCIDPQERIFYSADGSCGKRDRLLTIPDSGPIFVCANNVRGGTELPRGQIRWVYDLSNCTKDETGYVTPAAPLAADDAFTVGEDLLLDVPDRGVLDNDSDFTGAPLTAELVEGPTSGAFSFNAGGGFTYDPRGRFDHLDAGERADVTFRYQANDGALDSNVATVTVAVLGANDRPVAAPDAAAIDEDGLLEIAAPGVLGNDDDADGHPLNARLLDDTASGRLNLSSEGGYTFDPRGAFDALPAGSETTATFTYVANDGTVDSDATRTTITVLGVNDPPVGGPDTATTDENSELVLARTFLLANDADADDGTALTIVSASQPSDGMLRVEGDNFVFDPTADADLDQLAAGETRSVTFVYTLSDGLTAVTVPVSIAVTGISAPTAVADAVATDEDTAVETDVLLNDDVQGATLTLPASTKEGGTLVETGTTGVVRYVPPASFQALPEGVGATDSFSYALHNSETAQDGQPSVGAVTLTITGRNDAPTASDRSFSLTQTAPLHVGEPDGLRKDAVDVDNSRADLTAVLVAPPSRGRLTLADDGSFTFDPAGDFPEPADTTFAYRLSDGLAESDVRTVNLAVGTNAFPEVPDGQIFRITETAASGELVGLMAVDDPDHADPDTHLTFELIDSQGLAVTVATLPDDEGRGRIVVDGTLSVGTFELTVDVTDDRGATTRGVVTVQVDPPLAAFGDRFQAVGNTELIAGGGEAGTAGPAGVVHVSNPVNVLDNDGGTGGDVVVEATSGTTPNGGAYTIYKDGSFRYLPPTVDPSTPGSWDGASPLDDHFDYTVIRYPGQVDEQRSVARVDVVVGTVVWYVDRNAAAPGDGTAWAPLSTLTPLAESASADRDGPDQVIFVLGAGRPPYHGTVHLEDGQRFLGQPAGLFVDGLTLMEAAAAADAAAVAPVLTTSAGPSLVLGRGNVVKGLLIEAAAGVVGADIGSLDLDLLAVSTAAGPALDFAGAPATGEPLGRVAVGSIAADDPAGSAVTLRGTAAAVMLGDVKVGTPGAAALAIHGNRGMVDVRRLHGSGADAVGITSNRGSVSLGSVEVSTPGTVLAVDDNAGTLAAGTITADGPASGLVITGNRGMVQIASLSLTAVTTDAIRTVGNDGTITVAGGSLAANTAQFTGRLVDVDGGNGALEIAAVVRLPALTDGTAPAGGRTVSIEGLTSCAATSCVPAGDRSGSVIFTGSVEDHSGGIELIGNTPTALVRFAGPLAVSTAGTPAFRGLNVGTLELVNGPATLHAVGAPALRIAGASVGPLGARFDDVSGSGARFVASDALQTGATLDVSAISSPTGAAMHVLGGAIMDAGQTTDGDRCLCAAVQVTGSDHVRLGAMSVEGSNGDGVGLSGTAAVTLAGVRIDRPRGDGITTDGGDALLLDGVTVDSAGGRGVAITDPSGTVLIRGTTIRASGSTQVDVIDRVATTGAATRDAIVFDGTSVNDGTAEQPNIRVRATDDPDDGQAAADLEIRTEGIGSSGSFGGSVGLDVLACDGASATVNLSKFSVAGTAGDGIRVGTRNADPGDEGCDPHPGSRLSFAFSDMQTVDGGGVNVTSGAGIRLVGSGPGSIAGSLDQVDVNATRGGGVVVDDVEGLTFTDVAIAPQEGAGFLLQASQGMTLRNVEVTGPPSINGIELRNVRDITVVGSRIDLRTGQTPERPARPVDPAEACVPPHDPRPAAPEDAPLHAGIFGRHLGGTISVTDTVVRGAEFHEIVLANGQTSANPDIDPPGTPVPALTDIELDATVVLGGLSLLDTHVGAAGALVEAGPYSTVFLRLPGDAPSTLDGPIVACASPDGDDLEEAVDGHIYTQGGDLPPGLPGPHLKVREGSDAFIARAAGYGAVSSFDLYGIHVEYIRALGDATTGRAVRMSAVGHLVTVHVPGVGSVTFLTPPGRVFGTMHSFTIQNSPGAGIQTSGGSDLLYEGGTILDSGGPGVLVDGGKNIELRNTRVERSGDSAIVVRRARDVVLADTTIIQPAGSGLDVVDAQTVTAQGTKVTQPRQHGIYAWAAEDLTLRNTEIDLVQPAGAAPLDKAYAGVFARHMGGTTTIEDLDVVGATLDAVRIANGDVPAFDDAPYAPADDLTLLPTLPTSTQLALSAFTTTQTPADESSISVVAGGGGTVSVDLAGAASTVDGPVVLQAVENAAGNAGGSLTVRGGHLLNRTHTGDALTIAADGPHAVAMLDLTGLVVVFPPADTMAPAGSGVVLLAQNGGALGGRVSASVTDARGPGITIAGATGLHVDGGTIGGAGGPGLHITDSRDVGVSNVLVADLVGHGLYAWDVTGLQVSDSTFDLTTSRDVAADAAPYSGVFARHVDGIVHLERVTVVAPTGPAISAVNGADQPWVDDTLHEPEPADTSTSGSAHLALLAFAVSRVPSHADAVLVGSGLGSSMTADLGSDPALESTADRPVRMETAGGTLAVIGGHHLNQNGAANGWEFRGPGVTLSTQALGVSFPQASSTVPPGTGILLDHVDDAQMVGSSVSDAGNAGIELLGGTSALIQGTVGLTISAGGPGIRVHGEGTLCLGLDGVTATSAGDVGFAFAAVGLEGRLPGEPVGDWLARRDNTGTFSEGTGVTAC